jgi:hypothetical protein
MGQQRFKTITPPQPALVYGQDVPGVVRSQVGEPDITISGTVIGMQYVVCEDDRYIQTWRYQVEFRRAEGCPVSSDEWYDEADLSEPVAFTARMPEPVSVRTHDEMQRNHTVFPNVVVEFTQDGIAAASGRNHVIVTNATLVEAAHDAHRVFFYLMNFPAALRRIRGVTGYPKGLTPMVPK